MGAQVATQPGDERSPDWFSFEVTPPLCRSLCCETASETVAEVWDTEGKSFEDQSWTTHMLQASYQRAVGWPEHFEKELDELRILGVLGFELRGALNWAWRRLNVKGSKDILYAVLVRSC
eukprot:g1994.t1